MIERQDKDWGIRLIATPFSTQSTDFHFLMQIEAEIKKPTGRGKPEIRISFLGVPIGKPLLPVDARTWRTAFDAVLTEAERIAKEMKPSKSKRKGRK